MNSAEKQAEIEQFIKIFTRFVNEKQRRLSGLDIPLADRLLDRLFQFHKTRLMEYWEFDLENPEGMHKQFREPGLIEDDVSNLVIWECIRDGGIYWHSIDYMKFLQIDKEESEKEFKTQANLDMNALRNEISSTHTLYRATDFAVSDASILARNVVEGGLGICKKCGAAEADLYEKVCTG